jgi:hypothetical protein
VIAATAITSSVAHPSKDDAQVVVVSVAPQQKGLHILPRLLTTVRESKGKFIQNEILLTI